MDSYIDKPVKPERLQEDSDLDFKIKLKNYRSEYSKFWKRKNSEKVKAYGKQWKADNPDKVALSTKKWKDKNPDKILLYNNSLKEDSIKIERIRSSWKINYRNRKLHNSSYAASLSSRASLNNNVKRYLEGKKDTSVLDLIGCTVEEFVKYIEDQFVEGMTWTPKNFHLDHKKPCSSFDLTDLQQQKICFHYSNYQPLWPRENLQKSKKLDWNKKGENNEC